MFGRELRFKDFKILKFVFRIGEEETDVDEQISSKRPLFNKDTDQTTYSSCANGENDEQGFSGLWTGSKQQDLVSGVCLYFQQFRALFVKRFIHSLRNKSLIISQVFLPILILMINLIYLKYGPIIHKDSPMLRIDFAKYGKNYAPYRTAGSTFLNQLGDLFETQLQNQSNTNAFNLNDKNKVGLCFSACDSIENYLIQMAKLGFGKLNDEHFVAADFTLEAPVPFKKPATSKKAGLFQNFLGKRASFNFKDMNKRLTVVGHFNNQPYHVAPLMVNLLTNTLLKYFTKSKTSHISVINHPLPRNLTDITNEIKNKDLSSFNIASGLTFGFSFLIASFAIILIKERESGAKHLQFMNGCNSFIFWLSAFMWDLLNYSIPILSVVGLLKVYKKHSFD